MEINCSFCGAGRHDAELIIVADGASAAICSSCIEVCAAELNSHRSSSSESALDAMAKNADELGLNY